MKWVNDIRNLAFENRKKNIEMQTQKKIKKPKKMGI